MQSKLCLLPGETELEDQDLKGMEFVEACTRKKKCFTEENNKNSENRP